MDCGIERLLGREMERLGKEMERLGKEMDVDREQKYCLGPSLKTFIL
jgi:hypothetical protein